MRHRLTLLPIVLYLVNGAINGFINGIRYGIIGDDIFCQAQSTRLSDRLQRKKLSLQAQRLMKRKRYKRSFAKRSVDGTQEISNGISMSNVTCHFYAQPLDHFSAARKNTLMQRYCVYEGYDIGHNSRATGNGDDMTSENPIFFYTGNESPIDEYVNNTGLVWELAAKPHFNALVVFAEHRFEGESLPSNFGAEDGGGCFEYLTTSQALHDFISLISYLNPDNKRPVIAFGGSYGGMLSAWLRMKYPSSVAGSIAASAPIFGFPKTMSGDITITKHGNIDAQGGDDYEAVTNPNQGTMDGAFHIVGNGIKLELPDSTGEVSTAKNHCYNNLLATWPLIQYYGRSKEGRKVLTREFDLCQPLRDENDVSMLLDWAQSPWFNLAEGDYPYDSSYIPYALGEGHHNLPAWPLQKACHGSSGLSHDMHITIEGDKENVRYEIFYGKDELEETSSNIPYKDKKRDLVLTIDWDEAHFYQGNEGYEHDIAIKLFSAVKDSVAIWFNVTESLDCFDVVPAINNAKQTTEVEPIQLGNSMMNIKRKILSWSQRQLQDKSAQSQKLQVCTDKLRNETIWTSLVCNENLNLIMTYARGIGGDRDFFWPPSHGRHDQNYFDTVSNRTEVEELFDSLCSDPNGIFGYPDKTSVDPYSTFLDELYGGLRIGYHSNIIFSNGLLDPWSAAGVYGKTNAAEPKEGEKCMLEIDKESFYYDCDMLQNVTNNGSVLALILDLGAHHLDLMFSNKEDPKCARDARKIEEHYILKWINEWRDGCQLVGDSCNVF